MHRAAPRDPAAEIKAAAISVHGTVANLETEA
jgi:hypothetical protein